MKTEKFIRHMPFVALSDQKLLSLARWWQRVALVGKINSQQVAATLLDDLQSTRNQFEELRQQLVASLVHEKLNKLNMELGSSAQVAIDILIRNLFERTADVGFLATDDDIRKFLGLSERTTEDREQIVERLREYTAKYSVYDEVILLEPNGRILAHLDETNPVPECSRDPLIAEALSTEEPYVECFHHSDLQPLQRAAHLFAARITETNDPHSRVLGILCLCFRFNDEMRSIFSGLLQGDELLATVDEHGKAIASSDESRLPFGTPLMLNEEAHLQSVRHQGVDYLARTVSTSGYQDYFGLPWRGHVMQSIDGAFADDGASHSDSPTESFEPHDAGKLDKIRLTAALVTEDLSLAVLNGQIIAAQRDAAEFMPVLEEIRQIGRQTREVFDHSIASLQRTVRDSMLSDAEFQAFLAIDIMDRNLYERANDVRWWALNSRFKEILANEAIISSERPTLESILAYINDLYTVYTNLFLFDRQGTIVAVSRPEEKELVGTPVPEGLPLEQALQVKSTQEYVVSDFQPTPVYDDRPTYVYMTSVYDPSGGKVAGGIGIVFDSEPQFRGMLEEVLPHDETGAIADGAFGLFVDPQGKVIASTRDDLSPGQQLAIEPSLLQLSNGERTAQILEYQDHTYVVGAAMSQGYREYKTTGSYTNDVMALVFIPL